MRLGKNNKGVGGERKIKINKKQMDMGDLVVVVVVVVLVSSVFCLFLTAEFGQRAWSELIRWRGS